MKQWNHHQKGQGNDTHDYGAASRSQGALSFVSLFISNMGHLMNIQKPSKTKAVTAGLFTTCWAPFNQLCLSERSPHCKTLSIYLYNEHLCRLSWCKKDWTILDMSASL